MASVPSSGLEDSPTPTSTQDQECNLFRIVCDNFVKSLSKEDKLLFSSCDSAQQLLHDVGTFKPLQDHKSSRTRRILKQIKKLSDALQPYFDLLTIFAQSNQFAGIALGGFRLALQLASNFVGFFERLAHVIERLGNEFPQYDRIERIIRNSKVPASEALKTSISRVFEDILCFFHDVVRVFTRASGRIKRSPVVISDLLWTPFDVRFERVLERMRMHRELLKDEIVISLYENGLDRRDKDDEERARAARERQGEISAQESAKRTEKVTDSLRLEIERDNRGAYDVPVNLFEPHTNHRHFPETCFIRVRRWLNPPDFATELEKNIAIREDGTTQWISQEPLYQKWADLKAVCDRSLSVNERIVNPLWIYGKPGSGKTVIGASVVEELKDVHSTNIPVYYFFFKYELETMNNTRAALRAILCQFLQSQREYFDIIDKFAFIMNEESSGQLTATEKELLELCIMCFQSINDAFIILDGIDECTDTKLLTKTVSQILSFNKNVRVLFLSRPHVSPLTRMVPEDQRLLTNKVLISKDISIFLKREIEDMIEENLIDNGGSSDDLVGHLTCGADGMFLWARLMVSYLKSPALTARQRLQTIRNVLFPEGLENMYDRMLQLIQRGSTPERDLAQRTIRWLLYARRKMSLAELHEALLPNDEYSSESPDRFQDFSQTVTVACGGLIHCETLKDPLITPSKQAYSSCHLEFIHLSAREFFTYLAEDRLPDCTSRLSGATTRFYSKSESEIELALSCLRYILYRIVGQPLSCSLGRPLDQSSLASSFPFGQYSASYWTTHLRNALKFDQIATIPAQTRFTDRTLELVRELSSFLSSGSSIMAWIEICYSLCGYESINPRQNFENLGAWSEEASKLGSILPSEVDEFSRIRQDIACLSKDLLNIADSWDSRLTTHPSSIWTEITAFTPSRFLPRNVSTSVTHLTPTPGNISNRSSKCLCVVSELARDGECVGVLSIWPSRAFEERWNRLKSSDSHKNLFEICSGWVARYEIWSTTSNPSRLAEASIPLEQDEIWLQIRQSMRQDIWNIWKMRFPVKIGKDCRLIIILRTVIRFSQSESAKTVKFQAKTLKLDMNEAITREWCTDREGFEPASNIHLPENLALVRQNLYAYEIKLSPGEHYLSFEDFGSFNSSTLAVFRIDSSDNLNLTLVNSWQMKCGLISLDGFKTAFQEEQHLFTYLYDNGIMLLCLKTGEVTEIPVEARNVDKLIFSGCGKYLVFETISESVPIIVPVPPEFIKEEIKVQRTSLNTVAWLTDGMESALSQSDQTKDLEASAGATFKRRIVAVDEFGEAHETSLRLVDKIVSLDQIHGKNEESLHLTHLPDWPEVDSLQPALKYSWSEKDLLAVVLNRASRSWNSLSNKQNPTSPLIVNRDARVLPPPIQTKRTEGEAKWRLNEPRLETFEQYANQHEAGEGGANHTRFRIESRGTSIETPQKKPRLLKES